MESFIQRLARRVGKLLSIPARRTGSDSHSRLNAYMERLLAGDPMTSEEVALIHRLKLELDRDPETRIRSIQTLADLGDPSAIPFAFADLLHYASQWPNGPPPSYYALLLKLIQEIAPRDSERKSTPRDAEVGQDLLYWAYLASEGIPADDVPLNRVLPLRLYLSRDDPAGTPHFQGEAVIFAHVLGFGIVKSFPPEGGSWFKQFFVRTKEALTRDEVRERLMKAERALELAALHQRQAQVDHDLAEAAAKLVEALGGVPEGACQLGSLLVLKHEGDDGRPRLMITQLTQQQLIWLESAPQSLRSPREVLKQLGLLAPPSSDSTAEDSASGVSGLA